MPWSNLVAHGWFIVCMNHFRVEGRQYLYVAMIKGRECIQSEDQNEADVFWDLEVKAGLRSSL